MSPLKLTLAMAGTAVLAGAAGYVGGTLRLRSAVATLFSVSFEQAAANAAQDVRALRSIRLGEVAKATSMLEDRLDMNLLYLSSYEATVPPEFRNPVVYRNLEAVGAYRAQVPSTASSAEVQSTIRRALTFKAADAQ